MKIYYSHPKIYRNSEGAKKDVIFLEGLNYTVDNPYNPKYSDLWQSEGFGFSKTLIEGNDALAFRPLEDGKISIGVAKEIETAVSLGKDIIELPEVYPVENTDFSSRTLSMDETMDYFAKARGY